MALSPGTRFGPYEVADAIGAGGMGEVYRATDTTLGREVAIKTLPSALAADTDRLARFEREAKLLATLNHPNIAIIYGLEEQDGTRCIAMELIEGQTLEEKLKDGPLPTEDVLRVALQIAQALEAAHEKGVIHRDLKPANVMITSKGLVKVLDFGLAKAFSDDPDQSNLGQSPALSLAMTQQGLVLGTASYMSPEQASGQATDQRSDVWAFGVVLFEMLSGLPLFKGESIPHILADVLKTDPDWKRLPKTLDPRLKVLLDRCLRKKPHNRYHAIADARIDIEEILSDPDGLQIIATAPPVTAERSVIPLVAASVILTAVVSGVIAWIFVTSAEIEPRPVIAFDHTLPGAQTFRFSNRRLMDVSPDGRYFVYNADDGLYVRAMDELEARLIPGTESFLSTPTISPDGQTVAYWDISSQLRRIAISGGAPVTIADDIENDVFGMSWAADGMIYFSQPGGIYRVSANAGTPELIIPIESGEGLYYSPRLLPDRDSLLFSLSAGVAASEQTVVQSLSTGERTMLIETGGGARYLPTGHLIYLLGDGLFAMAFDLGTLTVSGGAVPLVQGVLPAALGAAGAPNYAVAEDGTLVYVSGGGIANAQNALVWVDRDGREESINAPPRTYFYPRISPDGTKVAIDIRDEELDIWVWELARETLTRLTFDPANDRFPSWSPDGQRIAFSTMRDSGVNNVLSIYSKAADGTGSAQRLAEGSGQMFPVSFAPDGSAIVVSGALAGGTQDDDIAILSLEEQNSLTTILQTQFSEANPEVSPDGRWIAYSSDESGQVEIYVRPFPNVEDGRWQVSVGGGAQPLWAHGGEELFYRADEAMMSVPVQTDENFVAGSPQLLFEIGNTLGLFGGRSYDVSQDGRFLMVKELESASQIAHILVVKNWFEELEQLAPPAQ